MAQQLETLQQQLLLLQNQINSAVEEKKTRKICNIQVKIVKLNW